MIRPQRWIMISGIRIQEGFVTRPGSAKYLCAKGDSNPLTSKPKPHPSRDPAVTTKACVEAESRFVLPDPSLHPMAWQPHGSGKWCENGFQIRRSEADSRRSSRR